MCVYIGVCVCVVQSAGATTAAAGGDGGTGGVAVGADTAGGDGGGHRATARHVPRAAPAGRFRTSEYSRSCEIYTLTESRDNHKFKDSKTLMTSFDAS